MSKNQKRGNRPSNSTISNLWVMAGGRCQFDGCNCKLFRDDLTWNKFNGSNVAHIVASSPDGPRGNEDSNKLSDKLENLMLLCPTHHKEIDTFVEKYSVEMLTDMKKRQERKVQELLDGMNYKESEIIILESPIKGNINSHVDYKQAVDALRSIRKKPTAGSPTLLKIKSNKVYSSREYWKDLILDLNEMLRGVRNHLEYNPNLMLAIFPLAPIPLIAKLGELLSDKRVIDIFQKIRIPDTWIWQEFKQTNSFRTERKIIKEGDISKVAIIMSLSAKISEERVKKVFNVGIIYHIYAERIGVDSVYSLEDLKIFWQEYQRICNQIKNNDSISSASVFPAIPVSAAFEIGRRHMPKVHPKLNIYDDDNGFFEALTIGE